MFVNLFDIFFVLVLLVVLAKVIDMNTKCSVNRLFRGSSQYGFWGLSSSSFWPEYLEEK